MFVEDKTVQPAAGNASAKLRMVANADWEVWVFNPMDARPHWKRLGPPHRYRLHAEDRARLFLAHCAVKFYSYQMRLNESPRAGKEGN